jgi:hypothetical protein
VGKWLAIYKNSPETPIAQTDKTNTVPAVAKKIDRLTEAGKASRLIKEQGWCAVQSLALGGEIVIWARDGKVVVPVRWQSNVRYEMDELVALDANGGISKKGLRQIHQAKKLFEGQVHNE